MRNDDRPARRVRLPALILVVLWAVTAVAVAAAYRPGGPVDIVVVVACCLPVLVAAVALVWPPEPVTDRHWAALAWVWILAGLFAIPVLYGVTATLAAGGPQDLVPSVEAAYAGLVAVAFLSFYSVLGLVHRRRGAFPFERTATWRTAGVAALLTLGIAGAFGLVVAINDQALRETEPRSSRYGPTDPDVVPPSCDGPLAVGPNATVTIAARSEAGDVPRGSATLSGRRSGGDEVWGGSWSGPDGTGELAYLRIGPQAWLHRGSDDPEAPGTTWTSARPGLFDLLDPAGTTMDGPIHALVDRPSGSLVPEDLGLEVIDGARARHCRTFVDGPTALAAVLPLRWLVDDDPVAAGSDLDDWRGTLDWWVFSDGQLGRATTRISGLRSATDWQTRAVRGMLEAQLEAVDRDRPVDVAATVAVTVPLSPAPTFKVQLFPAPTSPVPSMPAGSPAALESAAP